MTEYRGTSTGRGRRVCVVASRFNLMVTERLLDGALAALAERGVAESDVDVVRVPGAWELPVAAGLATARGYDAIVALGCIIRGETPHFDHVSRAALDGLRHVQATTGVPIGLGVLTTEDLPQALDRSGGDVGHAGVQAVEAALEMADLAQTLRNGE